MVETIKRQTWAVCMLSGRKVKVPCVWSLDYGI